ncbi:MAG: hypothetical protein ABFD75_06580 [Smithella sp.]
MWIKYVYASGRDQVYSACWGCRPHFAPGIVYGAGRLPGYFPETNRQGFHIAGEWSNDFICALKGIVQK